MRKTLLFLAFSVAAGAAQAQIKCWNEGGRRVCGDAPPAGAKVTTLKAPASGADPAPAANEAAKDAKDAKKGPLTAAEREQESRKRDAEAKKAAEKSATAEKDAAAKRENCERARASLRELESGQRIARTDSKGERYFLDDSQLAQEVGNARKIAQDSCGN